MTKCPKCDNDVARMDMDLYTVHHNGGSVIEEYCCHCPTCGHVFGVNLHYAYDHTEIEEEWD